MEGGSTQVSRGMLATAQSALQAHCSFMAGANLAGIQGQPVDFPQQFPTGWGAAGSVFAGPGAKLAGVGFGGADFRGISLRGANLGGANAAWSNFTGVDFTGANISDMDAQFATFTGANFSGVTFLRSDFTSATLVNASFRGAIFSDDTSQFGGANVSGSDFTGASNPFGVLTQMPSDPYSFLSAGIYAPSAVSNNVICAPGVVTNDWATCFPPARAFPMPRCLPGAGPVNPYMPVMCNPTGRGRW